MSIGTVELVLTVFLAIILVAEILSQKARVPYTLVLVFIGIGVTALSSLAVLGPDSAANPFQAVVSQMRSFYDSLVQGGLFVGLVVPPLIFEAMMHIRAPDLRAIIRPTMVLATAGVVITTIVGGMLLWQFAGLSFTVAFLFAAVISPTDVVTVLEVFRRVTAPSKLATLMDMEAAFNDATGIIVFSIVLSSINVPGIPLFPALFRFGYTLLGGVVVGLIVAFGARKIRAIIYDRIAETILTISAVYGSYVFATGLGVSGLIAVAVVGLYFGNVTMNAAMEPGVRDTILTFWQVAAFLGNSVAFLLIGFETNIVALSQSIELILIAYVAVIVARAAAVYPILAIFSQVWERIPITWSNVTMLGGIRGALSIALAASISASALLPASQVRTITTMVLGVAFLSITIQGLALSQYMKRKFGSQERLM